MELYPQFLGIFVGATHQEFVHKSLAVCLPKGNFITGAYSIGFLDNSNPPPKKDQLSALIKLRQLAKMGLASKEKNRNRTSAIYIIYMERRKPTRVVKIASLMQPLESKQTFQWLPEWPQHQHLPFFVVSGRPWFIQVIVGFFLHLQNSFPIRCSFNRMMAMMTFSMSWECDLEINSEADFCPNGQWFAVLQNATNLAAFFGDSEKMWRLNLNCLWWKQPFLDLLKNLRRGTFPTKVLLWIAGKTVHPKSLGQFLAHLSEAR